jgi:hypothetical protein
MNRTVLIWAFAILVQPALFASQQAQQITVATDHGPFEFNVKIRVSGAPIISGTITNNTDRSWENARFEVALFDRQQRALKNPMGSPWTLTVRELPREKTVEIGLKVWGDQMAGRVDGKIERFEIRFVGGDFPVSYSVELV